MRGGKHCDRGAEGCIGVLTGGCAASGAAADVRKKRGHGLSLRSHERGVASDAAARARGPTRAPLCPLTSRRTYRPAHLTGRRVWSGVNPRTSPTPRRTSPGYGHAQCYGSAAGTPRVRERARNAFVWAMRVWDAATTVQGMGRGASCSCVWAVREGRWAASARGQEGFACGRGGCHILGDA